MRALGAQKERHAPLKYFNALTAAALTFGLCANASAAFVINELDADTPGTDTAEYIELKGNPGESADGLILVFYDGSDGSISFNPAVDLAGLTADENGYLLLGSANVLGVDKVLPDAFIRNAQEAVALYQDLASNHPAGSSPTTTNLVDVVVHRAINAENNDWTGSARLHHRSPTKAHWARPQTSAFRACPMAPAPNSRPVHSPPEPPTA